MTSPGRQRISDNRMVWGKQEIQRAGRNPPHGLHVALKRCLEGIKVSQRVPPAMHPKSYQISTAPVGGHAKFGAVSKKSFGISCPYRGASSLSTASPLARRRRVRHYSLQSAFCSYTCRPLEGAQKSIAATAVAGLALKNASAFTHPSIWICLAEILARYPSGDDIRWTYSTHSAVSRALAFTLVQLDGVNEDASTALHQSGRHMRQPFLFQLILLAHVHACELLVATNV